MQYGDMTADDLDAFIATCQARLTAFHNDFSEVYNAAEEKPEGGAQATWTASQVDAYADLESAIEEAKEARAALEGNDG